MKTLFNQLAEIISPYPIGETETVLNDLSKDDQIINLPKNLTCNHSDYHEVEGILIEGYYYLVVYNGEVNENLEDFTITIGKVERAPESDIDSEYQRIFKLEKPIYDQLVQVASDEYEWFWFDEDVETERECRQDQLNDLRINQE